MSLDRRCIPPAAVASATAADLVTGERRAGYSDGTVLMPPVERSGISFSFQEIGRSTGEGEVWAEPMPLDARAINTIKKKRVNIRKPAPNYYLTTGFRGMEG